MDKPGGVEVLHTKPVASPARVQRTDPQELSCSHVNHVIGYNSLRKRIPEIGNSCVFSGSVTHNKGLMYLLMMMFLFSYS